VFFNFFFLVSDTASDKKSSEGENSWTAKHSKMFQRHTFRYSWIKEESRVIFHFPCKTGVSLLVFIPFVAKTFHSDDVALQWSLSVSDWLVLARQNSWTSLAYAPIRNRTDFCTVTSSIWNFSVQILDAFTDEMNGALRKKETPFKQDLKSSRAKA